MLTRATLLAAVAGVLAAVAIVEIAATAGVRAAARGGTARPRSRRLAEAVGRVGRLVGLQLAPPAALAQLLAASGAPTRVGVRDVMAVKVGGLLVAAAVILPFSLSVPGRLGPVLALLVPAAAFLAPDALLRRRARQRARVMAEELPEVLDLLRVVVAAGLPLGRAMEEVGARRRGLLAAELARAADRVALGVPRAEAMRTWQTRCPLPAAGTLVEALGRSERHGVPLAPALAGLAAEARAQRARRLTDRAARAAPKIQLVIALLLVPAVLLLVAAALIGALT